MIGARVTIAREEFVTLCVSVQKCSDAQLSCVRRLAASNEVSDHGVLADLGDAVASIGLATEILKAVMSPPEEPPAEGGHCDA